MTRTLSVAAIQLAAHDTIDFDDVWPEIRDRIADTAKNGASIIVLPEGTIPGYVLGDTDIRLDRVERTLVELRSLAKKLRFLAVCGIVRADGQNLFNSAVTIDVEGTVAGYADKFFLWHFDRRWFHAGGTIASIQTTLGRLGVLICADGRMPQIARKLVDDGAELLIMPTAWVTSGRNPAALENVQADLLARVRARENGVALVAANKAGVERGCVAYCGKSQIVDADGAVIAMASQFEPQVIVADIVVSPAKPRRVATAPKAPQRTAGSASIRVAITPFVRDARTDVAMELVEAVAVIAPDDDNALSSLDRLVPTIEVRDDRVEDPGGLVELRRSGYRVVVWNARHVDPQWIEPLARARALELRLYLIVIDRREQRSFAVDPDGTIVAGTFGELRVASFELDSARADATLLVPGTDVATGLDRLAVLGTDLS
jgi:predicted amidohydrolase